jgi:hypothetical protein
MTRDCERGAALLTALMAMTLMLALGAALVIASTSETFIALNFRLGTETLYAADAMLERAIGDLETLASWQHVPSGTLLASFADGPPSGIRVLGDNHTIDLVEVRNMANCQARAGCTALDLDRIGPGRPWGAANPRWQLYAFGTLASLAGGQRAGSPIYVVAFVADDPSDSDGDPSHDGLLTGAIPNPGRNLVMVRAEAFGIRGAHRVVEATIARVDTAATAVTPAWSEVRIVSRREGG